MDPSEAEFLRKRYGEKSTGELIAMVNNQPMTTAAFNVICELLSVRGVSKDQYPENPKALTGSALCPPVLQSLSFEQESSPKNNINKLSYIFIPLFFSVILQGLYPAFVDAFASIGNDELRCTASIHGTRSYPCDSAQLISNWMEVMLFTNLFLFGVPTISMAIVLACVYEIISRERHRIVLPIMLSCALGTIFGGLFFGFSGARLIAHILFWLAIAALCKLFTLPTQA